MWRRPTPATSSCAICWPGRCPSRRPERVTAVAPGPWSSPVCARVWRAGHGRGRRPHRQRRVLRGAVPAVAARRLHDPPDSRSDPGDVDRRLPGLRAVLDGVPRSHRRGPGGHRRELLSQPRSRRSLRHRQPRRSPHDGARVSPAGRRSSRHADRPDRPPGRPGPAPVAVRPRAERVRHRVRPGVHRHHPSGLPGTALGQLPGDPAGPT